MLVSISVAYIEIENIVLWVYIEISIIQIITVILI